MPGFAFAAKPASFSLTMQRVADVRRRRVRNDDELVHLRAKRLEAALERGIRPVSDDDAGDAHVSSR